MKDEEKMARTLARILREEGHVAEIAADARSGFGCVLKVSFGSW